MPLVVRHFLTVSGCLSGGLFVVRVAKGVIPWMWTNPLGPFTLMHSCLLLFVPVVFDRYVLVLLPGVLSLLCHCKPGRAQCAAGCCVLILMGAMSVALMHDWL